MSEASNNRELSEQTAEALLLAIQAAAPRADGRGIEALKHLAEAYAAVVGAMPKRSGSGRVIA